MIKWDKSLSWLSRVSNKNLQTLLLRNDEVAIIIASELFQRLVKHYGYKDAIIRYNGFWEVSRNGKAKRDANGNRIKNTQYYDKVMKNMAYVKSTLKGNK